MDAEVLATADRTFSEEFLETTVRECAKDLSPAAVTVFITTCFCHRLRLPKNTALVWGTEDNYKLPFRRVTRHASITFLEIALDAVERSLEQLDGITAKEIGCSNTLSCLSDILRFSHWKLPTHLKDRLLSSLAKIICASLPPEVIGTLISILCSRRELVTSDLSLGEIPILYFHPLI